MKPARASGSVIWRCNHGVTALPTFTACVVMTPTKPDRGSRTISVTAASVAMEARARRPATAGEQTPVQGMGEGGEQAG